MIGFSCNSGTNHTINGNIDEPIDELHFDSVMLNKSIPLRLEETDLVKYLGEPDSIVIEDDWACGNYINGESTVKVHYYKGTKFISSKGIALLHVLNLEVDNFTFDFSGNQIKSGITKSELELIFPNSMKALKEKRQSYNRQGRMKVYMIETPEYGDSSGWIFIFDGEKLKEIELWWFIC